jgi:hypothetical protein
LGSSNRFKNLAPRGKRQFCIRNLGLFPNHHNHFYTFFFLLCICIANLVITPYSSPRPSTSRMADQYVRVYTWIVFPMCRKIGSWDKELLESVFFFNLGSEFCKLLEMLLVSAYFGHISCTKQAPRRSCITGLNPKIPILLFGNKGWSVDQISRMNTKDGVNPQPWSEHEAQEES